MYIMTDQDVLDHKGRKATVSHMANALQYMVELDQKELCMEFKFSF
jgi:hypothetical protein